MGGGSCCSVPSRKGEAKEGGGQHNFLTEWGRKRSLWFARKSWDFFCPFTVSSCFRWQNGGRRITAQKGRI